MNTSSNYGDDTLALPNRSRTLIEQINSMDEGITITYCQLFVTHGQQFCDTANALNAFVRAKVVMLSRIMEKKDVNEYLGRLGRIFDKMPSKYDAEGHRDARARYDSDKAQFIIETERILIELNNQTKKLGLDFSEKHTAKGERVRL